MKLETLQVENADKSVLKDTNQALEVELANAR